MHQFPSILRFGNYHKGAVLDCSDFLALWAVSPMAKSYDCKGATGLPKMFSHLVLFCRSERVYLKEYQSEKVLNARGYSLTGCGALSLRRFRHALELKGEMEKVGLKLRSPQED